MPKNRASLEEGLRVIGQFWPPQSPNSIPLSASLKIERTSTFPAPPVAINRLIMRLSKRCFVLPLLTALLSVGSALTAAPIPGLFGTGVDDKGALLAAGAVDPHYKLIKSADTNA